MSYFFCCRYVFRVFQHGIQLPVNQNEFLCKFCYNLMGSLILSCLWQLPWYPEGDQTTACTSLEERDSSTNGTGTYMLVVHEVVTGGTRKTSELLPPGSKSKNMTKLIGFAQRAALQSRLF